MESSSDHLMRNVWVHIDICLLICRLQCFICDFSIFSVGVKVPRAFEVDQKLLLYISADLMDSFLYMLYFYKYSFGEVKFEVNWEKIVDRICEISKCRHCGLGRIWLEFFFFEISTKTLEEIEGLFLIYMFFRFKLRKQLILFIRKRSCTKDIFKRCLRDTYRRLAANVSICFQFILFVFLESRSMLKRSHLWYHTSLQVCIRK